MKKYLILIMCAFLLTGCDVTYSIKIDDQIEELTSFYFEESDYNYDTYYINYGDGLTNFSSIDELVKNIINKDYLAFDGNFNNKELYNVQKLDGGMSLNYIYNYDNFDKSSLINYCGGNVVNYYRSDKIIMINVDDFSNCFMSEYGPTLNNLTINIKTDLKVLENNSDSVNGNIYTWNINTNNLNEKSLYINIRKSRIKVEITNYIIIFVVIVILLFLVFILVYYIIKKMKKNNEI